MNTLKEVTDTNLAGFLTEPNSILQFSANWCAPCRMLTPIITELSSELSEINFGKISVDSNPITSTAYGITSIPCLIFFKDGVEVERIKGVLPKQALRKKIQSILTLS